MTVKEWCIVGALILKDSEWLGALAKARHSGNVSEEEIKTAIRKMKNL